MSYPNYEAFPGQQVSDEVGGAGVGIAQPPQNPMVQQQMNSPGPYQGGNNGPQGSSAEGGDSKTTLWFALLHTFVQQAASLGGSTVHYLGLKKCHLFSTIGQAREANVMVITGWVN